MRKETGSILIERYDELGHRVDSLEGESYILAKGIAEKWENEQPGNSVVVSRILYNTKSTGDKWSHRL